MADALGPLILFGVIGLVGVGLVVLWTRQRDRDEARRQAKADAYDQREQEKGKAQLLAEIDRYFPFLHVPFRALTDSGIPSEEAFSTAFEEIEAVDLGTTFYGLPARLPLDERRKHLY